MSCILPSEIESLKEHFLEAGGLNAFRNKTSSERIKFFYDFLTKDMGKISNESKTAFTKNAETYASRIENQLLKSQNDAINDWTAFVQKSIVKQDILDMTITYKDILIEGQTNEFMDLLVRRKMGFSINSKDSTELLKLADSANQSLIEFKAKTDNLRNYDDRTNFSKERLELGKQIMKFKEKFDELKLKGRESTQNKAQQIIYEIAGNWKSLKASFDLSFGRQLSSAFYAGETGAFDAWKTGISAFWNGLAKPEKNAELKAMLFTRKNALNGNYAKFGLDIGTSEEAFPETALGRLPAVGKVFSASEQSFSLSLQYARANIFDASFDLAVKDMNGNVEGATRLLLQDDLGSYINSITGRGKVPWAGSPAERGVNYLLFSPRWLMSRIERITDLKYLPKITGSKINVQTKRARAAVRQIFFQVALAAGLKAIWDDDEDKWDDFFNPISGSFLQAKVKDIRIDTTFGQSGVLVALARAITGKTKTNEGVVKKQLPWTTIGRFISGKSSPFITGIYNTIQYALFNIGLVDEPPKTFSGGKWTSTEFIKEGLPITLQQSLETEEGARLLRSLGMNAEAGDSSWATVILDAFGIGAREMGADKNKEGLSEDIIKEQSKLARKLNKASPKSVFAKNSLLGKLTGTKRDKAEKEFQEKLNREWSRLQGSSQYKRMSNEQRDKEQRKIRTQVQNQLKKKYGLK